MIKYLLKKLNTTHWNSRLLQKSNLSIVQLQTFLKGGKTRFEELKFYSKRWKIKEKLLKKIKVINIMKIYFWVKRTKKIKWGDKFSF